MKFVPRTLEKVLETKEGGIVGYELNWARTLGILKQLANGIKALIAEDYVSGDIKPDNVLVDEEYNVFLCDFGSAKKGGRNLPTVNGEYGPIEVKESGQGDSKKSDIYSYGVILLQVIMKENHFACLDRASSLNEQVDFYKKILKGGTSRRDSNSSKSQKLEPHVSILARVAKERQGHAVHKTLLQSGCSTSDAEKLTVLGIACTEEKVNSRPLIETVIATLGEFNV
ncbi:PREDICTED: probable receptor-like protein kinase At4g10390 [Erythranthe guttata]|uniref:probable receptor-like protein kinase At4g10390 n=1 Tax=Erythranthe guttata TaxID=4155 RepID=UPI00064D9171|nr:PREDICTED: probable receptor-like protein kinase At4g10390 [Erythranthe guttata]|eukprot:XP_012830654.1 PREDICTED: probable receptor-like protein kinase At4g10390 [Erythranthe guttata]